ncbi:MAG: DUF1203 domain-containing protein [Bacteroidota bacterium]
MKHSFQVRHLDPQIGQQLFTLSEEALRAKHAVKMIASTKPGFPCRISLQDAEVGEEVILFPYEHHATNSPYRASGAVFIRKQATSPQIGPNELPDMLLHRQLSVRAYDQSGMMKKTKVLSGTALQIAIEALFSDQSIHYLQIHNAGPGCFNCQIDRVG